MKKCKYLFSDGKCVKIAAWLVGRSKFTMRASASEAGFARYTAGHASDNDPETMNSYQLTALSVLINQGKDVGFLYDKEGNPRKYGSHTDIGPFEYRGAPDYYDAPPLVALTAPKDDDGLFSGQKLSMQATATDDFYIERVEFHVDGSLAGIVYQRDAGSGSLYSAVWSDASPGVHQITATAYDSAGQSAQTAPVSVEVACYVRQVVYQEEFEQELLINSANNPNSSTAAAYNHFKIERQSFDQITVGDSPANNDGTPRPGTSLHLYRASKPGETSTPANACRIIYTGPGIGTENAGRVAVNEKLSLEMEVWIGQSDVSILPFTMRTKNTDFNLFCFDKSGNTNYLGGAERPSLPYAAGRWYKVRIDMDMENRSLTTYLGDDILLQNEPVSPNEYFYSNEAELISRFHFARTLGSDVYVDNVKLFRFVPCEADRAEAYVTASEQGWTGNVCFHLESAGSMSLTAALAVYRGGRMVRIDMKQARAVPGENHIPLFVPYIEGAERVNVFVWDEYMRPLLKKPGEI